MVIAGCVAEFYFHDTPDDSYWESRSKWRVLFHMKRVLRYHLGSICFGGFFVALMQFLRYLFEYIQKNVKNDSKAVRPKCFVLECVSVCVLVVVVVVAYQCAEFVAGEGHQVLHPLLPQDHREVCRVPQQERLHLCTCAREARRRPVISD